MLKVILRMSPLDVSTPNCSPELVHTRPELVLAVCFENDEAYRGHSIGTMISPNLSKEEKYCQSYSRQGHCKQTI